MLRKLMNNNNFYVDLCFLCTMADVARLLKSAKEAYMPPPKRGLNPPDRSPFLNDGKGN
jgi:hypothetical protein